jgi:integrase
MPLSDTAVKNLKPADKAYKRSDADGLYLLVTPKGGRYWRFDYRHLGRRGTLALGVYPDVGLAAARDRRDAARADLANGRDPAIARVKAKAVAKVAAGTLLRDVGREFVEKRRQENLAPSTIEKLEWHLSLIDSDLGGMPIHEIEAPEILVALQKLERRGLADTVKRVRSMLGRVFRYGIATGRCKRDPAADLRDALISKPHVHHAAIFDHAALGAAMRAIDGYKGTMVVRTALWLTPRVFVRPLELRTAEWSHIDLDARLWRIPARNMKLRRDHIVPLAVQVAQKLQTLREVGLPGDYVFPSLRSPRVPMSENTINAALRGLGYTKEQLTAHGFRRTASTLLNEQGWNADWVERQLAHLDGNQVRRVYNAAEYLPDRTRMMQAWANELDRLKTLRPPA